MRQNFKNKTVLITGGSRGQGAAEARMFASAGAQVVIADVLDAEGGALAQSIRAAGGRADYRHLDVGNEQDWRDAVAFATATFGSLHVLVNNAGVALRGRLLHKPTVITYHCDLLMPPGAMAWARRSACCPSTWPTVSSSTPWSWSSRPPSSRSRPRVYAPCTWL